MDLATTVTIRAIINGLRKSGAISDEPHVKAIVTELEAVEGSLQNYGSDKRSRVRQLCIEIAADAGVETSIKSADAPAAWNF